MYNYLATCDLNRVYFVKNSAKPVRDEEFDMQVYTNRNHSIFGGNTRNHLMNRVANFFIEKLK